MTSTPASTDAGALAPYKGMMLVDASLLHALWCYGVLDPVTGVVYSYGTHQKCLDDADRLFFDRAAALRNSAPKETRGDEPHWVKVLADNWRGRNGNTTTGDSVRNSCADELEKVAARNGFAVPQQSPRLEREALVRLINVHAMCGTPHAQRAADAILAFLSPDTTVVSSTSLCAHGNEPATCTVCHMWEQVASTLHSPPLSEIQTTLTTNSEFNK